MDCSIFMTCIYSCRYPSWLTVAIQITQYNHYTIIQNVQKSTQEPYQGKCSKCFNCHFILLQMIIFLACIKLRILNQLFPSEMMDDGDTSGLTELSSNFADFKPCRPSFYKKEFKKIRESLHPDGQVYWFSIIPSFKTVTI